jgi:hypothetical protein
MVVSFAAKIAYRLKGVNTASRASEALSAGD